MLPQYLPYTAIISAAIIWGISTPITKIILEQIPPLTLSFLRFFIAISVLVVIGSFFHINEHISKRDLPKLLVLGLFAAGLTIPLGFIGLNLTSAIDAVAVSSLTPIVIAIASIVILKEKLTSINLIGQVLAITGVVIAISTPESITQNRYLGDFLVFLSAISWATSVILAKELFVKYHTYTITTFIFMVGSILLCPFALYEYIQNPSWINHVGMFQLVGVLFLGIVTSVVAWMLFEWGLRTVKASDAGISYHIQLIVGALAAFVLLGETISNGFLVGVAFIIIGILFATKHPYHYKLHHTKS